MAQQCLTKEIDIVENRQIISIFVKNSIPCLHFWIITIDRPPELTSNKDSSAALMFVICLNALSQTRRLTEDSILGYC